MDTTAIVILNYNNYKDTINCIESVLKYNTADVKFYVIDNASPNKECVPALDKYLQDKFEFDYLKIEDTDSTLDKYPRATFITSEQNSGYASGNNKALKFIATDNDIKYILILNNDILFIQDIIPGMIHGLNTFPRAAIVSALLLTKDQKDIDYTCARKNVTVTNMIQQNLIGTFRLNVEVRDKFYILKYNPRLKDVEHFEIELPSGSCMLLKKDFFLSIGGFDPNTFLYYEENILYKKVSHEHMTNYLMPRMKCVHLGAQSTSKGKKNYKQFKMYVRSRRYYVWHYSEANALSKFLFDFTFCLYHISKFISSNLKVLIERSIIRYKNQNIVL